DAETGEMHPSLSDGQRAYDLDIAQVNIVGELLDIDAEVGLPPDIDPDETAEEIVGAYETLWSELTREEVFGDDERYKLEERWRRCRRACGAGFPPRRCSTRCSSTGGSCRSAPARTSGSRRRSSRTSSRSSRGGRWSASSSRASRRNPSLWTVRNGAWHRTWALRTRPEGTRRTTATATGAAPARRRCPCGGTRRRHAPSPRRSRARGSRARRRAGSGS